MNDLPKVASYSSGTAGRVSNSRPFESQADDLTSVPPRHTTSGVETGGSGGSMNRGPELLGIPESGAKKFYARKEYATSEKLTSK